ncbi:DNA-binding transcriptional regulator, MocR family, contains an aminotransferase domain [Parafrankia irregularis]|uniref:DNA-binding transcriptional regulator, MocR family, contains an aminotransferase domain n=2 Tax=Parafrankia TaxID=2994362 RepID=A0A0S4QYN2_9ACTN|nr:MULTISPECIES: PLP-dependent aminotransferase family protein [Parafrankia]MBE3200443.1 PLP-dependent aminotransferase family protein [Parafrankia sp. CH37]CUU60693.1 DNA-binding transcriptional regulator, MocR family, contains an aminotransferase domain [Parafrankia irregularis]
MLASEVRALFAVASRPEIVSLAGGMPAVDALPLEAVAATTSDLITRRGAVALQYGSAQGDPQLRARICDVMAMEGITDAHPDNVVVTVGSQQALDLLTRVFIDPGDVVLTEGPTYVTAINTFAAYQARVVHVPMDADGLNPEALRETLARLAAEGSRVKMLYTVPTFQNPSGVTLTVPRRGEVVEACRRAGVLVVEDNPYGLLSFNGDPIRAMRADAPDDVVYLGSFSKTLAPGMRVGWALAPPPVAARLVLAAESAILSHSMFTQLTVEQYLATQPWPEQLKAFREMYRERRDAMLETLAETMPADSTWTRPDGGFFIWLTLPEGVDAKAMLPRAIAARVAYVPGTGFYADGSGRNAIRISYCYPPPDRVREGVRRLARVLRAELDLRDTFAPRRPNDQ